MLLPRALAAIREANRWPSHPKDWAMVDLWSEYQLVFDDGSVVEDGQVIPECTQVHLKPASATRESPPGEVFWMWVIGDRPRDEMIFHPSGGQASARQSGERWAAKLTGLPSSLRLWEPGRFEIHIGKPGSKVASSQPLRIEVVSTRPQP